MLHKVFSKILLLLLLPGLPAACGGGGGGGGASSIADGEGISLSSITFPSTTDLTDFTTDPPAMAPLSQQVLFTFSGNVGTSTQDSIMIYADPGTAYTGPLVALDPVKEILKARGVFKVLGNKVLFTPHFPSVPLDLSPSADIDAVPGLLPGFTYQIFVPIGTSASIQNLKNIDPAVVMPQTLHTGEVENLYFANVPLRPPALTSIEPGDGTEDLPVRMLDGTWLPHPFEGVKLFFDLPLYPSVENFEGCDWTGDGFPDPNLFFRCADQELLAAAVSQGGSLLVRVDTLTGALTEVGPFTGGEPLIDCLAFSQHGELTGLIVPDTLVAVDTETGEMFDEVEIQVPGGGVVTGICYGPDNALYGLAGPMGHRLLRIDRTHGEVPDETSLALPQGRVMKDLFFRFDGALFGLLGEEGSQIAETELVRIDPNTGTVTSFMDPLAGDVVSAAALSFHTVIAFERKNSALIRIDLQKKISSHVAFLQLPVGSERLELAAVLYDLGTQVELLTNTEEGSTILAFPAGIPPFGTEVELLAGRTLGSIRGYSEYDEQGTSPAGWTRLAGYTTFDPGTPVMEDAFLEQFIDLLYDGYSTATGLPPASWNVQDGDQSPPELAHLLAARGSGGTGELGDFLPHPAFPMVVLNTDYQPLPLAVGATPDIQKPVVVKGGVFNFRNIHIPDGVTVVGRGSNALVLQATGTITIEGTIDVSGDPGVDEISFDSAYIPTAGGIGGPGGGHGGMSQTPCPEDFTALNQLHSPPAGETGYGPFNLLHTGGRGGESGAKGPDIIWGGHDPDSRGAGGGGGHFLQDLREELHAATFQGP